jgi:Zn-dependent oligopeptidase
MDEVTLNTILDTTKSLREEMRSRLSKIEEDVAEIKSQTIKTNGRVNSLEDWAYGNEKTGAEGVAKEMNKIRKYWYMVAGMFVVASVLGTSYYSLYLRDLEGKISSKIIQEISNG